MGDRLEIYGLDLRHTPSVEVFCHAPARPRDRLDFIINNACQTVRRPPEFYSHMMEGEKRARARCRRTSGALLGEYEGLRRCAAGRRSSASRDAAELSQLPLLADARAAGDLFPEGQLDEDLQQVDLRERNSWRLLLDEVPTVELLEAQLVNAVAPFVLNARLKPLMLRNAGARQAHRQRVGDGGPVLPQVQDDKHPHTNMAKAALNMMTRTSAADYSRRHPHEQRRHRLDHRRGPGRRSPSARARAGFHPPLDIVDGAARIVDPIFVGVNTGEHPWGLFLKDYKPTD